MDVESERNSEDLNKEIEIDEETPVRNLDIFQQFCGVEEHEQIPQDYKFSISSKVHKPNRRMHNKGRNFRKILNSSSSNERLIPHDMKYESSRENSQREVHVFQAEENSIDSESFRKSFKKRYEESFSVENTIRDSSSQVSEHSERSYASMLPAVYKQEQQMDEEKKSGCNCKRSKCLKLYCECFQKQLFCNQNCNCHDCGNHSENVAEHKQAIIEALARNANGFEVEEDEKNEKVEQVSFSLGFDIGEVKKGCKCRKTHCMKKYCQCYQNGIACSPFCKCDDCHNTKQFRAKKDLQQKNKKETVLKSLDPSKKQFCQKE